jgi:hypothetical protein
LRELINQELGNNFRKEKEKKNHVVEMRSWNKKRKKYEVSEERE